MYLLKYTLSNVSTNVLSNIFLPKCPDPKIYSQKTLQNELTNIFSLNCPKVLYSNYSELTSSSLFYLLCSLGCPPRPLLLLLLSPAPGAGK